MARCRRFGYPKFFLVRLVVDSASCLKQRNKLPEEFRKKYPEVPWRSIIGLRNVLIHDYLGVDIKAVWGNLKQELPHLKEQIKSILEN
jgi:uncharacterized protein with HEPN domain